MCLVTAGVDEKLMKMGERRLNPTTREKYTGTGVINDNLLSVKNMRSGRLWKKFKMLQKGST